MYSNQVDLTLTANWAPPPQLVVQVFEGGIGIATQRFEQTLMEEETFPWSASMNVTVNTGPAPEFPPYAYIGFYVHLLPQGQTSPGGLTGPLFRSGFFATALPTPFPTDPNGMVSILELDASSHPITQAQLDSDVAKGFTLPHRLPAQIIVQSVSTPIGTGDITIIVGGTWTAPDLSSVTFKYVVSVRLSPSLEMFPDTSQVVGISTIGAGTISFSPNPDPFFLGVTDWAILTIFKPFVLGIIAPQLRSVLSSRIQTIVMNQAAALLNFPAGTSLPAGLVLSLERVRISPATGISVVAALGCFGPLSSKLPSSSGGGPTCLLTFLAGIPFVRPALDLAAFHAMRERMLANQLGRCAVSAYYRLSKVVVPWLTRHRKLSLAIRKLLSRLIPTEMGCR